MKTMSVACEPHGNGKKCHRLRTADLDRREWVYLSIDWLLSTDYFSYTTSKVNKKLSALTWIDDSWKVSSSKLLMILFDAQVCRQYET